MSNSDINEVLKSNYILLTIAKGAWMATKKDIAAAHAAASNAGSVEEAFKATKNIMAGADKELKELKAAQAAVNSYVYSVTTPFSSATHGAKRGDRLLPVSMSMQVIKELSKLETDYKNKKAAFGAVYEQRRQQAINNLGSAADASLYPTKEEVLAKFYVDIDMQPCPTVSDFSKVNLPAKLATALGNRMAQRQNQIVENAMQDINDRILKYVGNMAKQMNKLANGEKTKIFESLVGNVKAVAELVQSSNLTDDAVLKQVQGTLDELSSIDLKKVRQSATMAKDAAKKAESVVSQLRTAAPQPASATAETPHPEAVNTDVEFDTDSVFY